MLDEHLPTWAAKRSNNVGSSKVGALNPTFCSIVWPGLSVVLNLFIVSFKTDVLLFGFLDCI